MNTTIDQKLVSRIVTGPVSRSLIRDVLEANLCRTLYDWGATIRDIETLIKIPRATITRRLKQSVHLDSICDAAERAASQIGAALQMRVNMKISSKPALDLDGRQWKKDLPYLERMIKLTIDLERHRARSPFVAHSRGGAFRKPKPKAIEAPEPIKEPTPTPAPAPQATRTPAEVRLFMGRLLEGMLMYYREKNLPIYGECETIKKFQALLAEPGGHLLGAIERAASNSNI